MSNAAERWADHHGHDLYPETPSTTPAEVREWLDLPYALRYLVETECTPKQVQVLRLRHQGLTVQEVAYVTGTSRSGVQKHLDRIPRRLGSESVPPIALCRGEDSQESSQLNGHAPILIRTGNRSPGADTERLRALPVLVHDTRDFEHPTKIRNGNDREVACDPFILRALAVLSDDPDIAEAEARVAREQDRRARRGWASPADRLAMMRRWYARPPAVVIPFPMRPTAALEEAA